MTWQGLIYRTQKNQILPKYFEMRNYYFRIKRKISIVSIWKLCFALNWFFPQFRTLRFSQSVRNQLINLARFRPTGKFCLIYSRLWERLMERNHLSCFLFFDFFPLGNAKYGWCNLYINRSKNTFASFYVWIMDRNDVSHICNRFSLWFTEIESSDSNIGEQNRASWFFTL